MKELFAVMVSLAMLLGATACSSGNANNSQPSTSQSELTANLDAGGSASSEAISSEAAPASSAAPETETTPVDETVPEESEPEQAEGSNILIAYFSRVGNMDYDPAVDAVTSASVNITGSDISGNAQLLAQAAQEVTGGDLFFIETVEKYPAAYRSTTDKAKDEQNDNARPELASHVENMDAYDTIVLIYPNWWGTIPQAVCTFLEEYDFSGKTIWPLCTHEGSALGRSEGDLAALVPDAQLAEGLAVRGSRAGTSQADVEAWLGDLKVSE